MSVTENGAEGVRNETSEQGFLSSGLHALAVSRDNTATLPSASRSDEDGWHRATEMLGTRATIRRIRLMGVAIDSLTEREAVDRIITTWQQGRGGWVVTPNVDHLRMFNQQPELKRTIADRATLMLADGAPLVWASRIAGSPLPERVAGSHLVLSLSAAAAKVGASVFLLGGSPGTAERAATLLKAFNPGLKIAGIAAPPMGFEKDPAGIAALRERVVSAKPDLVYSCFGFPKQEWLIEQLRPHLPGSWFLGLGGSLSMIAGEFRRAPRWMQLAGCEWLFRLLQEPRRLFKRYLIYDAPFALRMLASEFTRRWIAVRKEVPPDRARASYLLGALTTSPNGTDQSPELELVTRARIIDCYARSGFSPRGWSAAARLKQLTWACFLGWMRLAKRSMDITGAIILLTLVSPLLVVFATLVKATSRGPALFKQQRVGERGRHFLLYKFRSMYHDAENRRAELQSHNEMSGGILFKIKQDPRITPLGSFMRRWSIDELPQLWNVLRGDMSLVGPRPPIPSEVEQYTLSQRRRLDAVPGLTCLWQVSGRSEIPFERQVELDVDYIESHSFTLDVKLLLQTVPAVLQRRGAY